MEWRANFFLGLGIIGLSLWQWGAPAAWFWPTVSILGLIHAYFLQSFLAEVCAFAQFAKVERYCDTMITATTIGAVLFLAIGAARLLGVTAGMHYFALAVASILLLGMALLIVRVTVEISRAFRRGRWKR